LARFDDLTPDGISFELSEPTDEFVARTPAEVPGTLHAAEDAARQGRWVAGFVGYEAAAGLDSALTVRPRRDDDPLAGLPLVWFAAFARHLPVPPVDAADHASQTAPWRPDRDRAWHAGAVAAIRESIARGDYYQLNLTARLRGAVRDPADTYAALAGAQAGAHHALIVTPHHAVISASPELFFARRGTHLVVRPMKGTAKRGRWAAEDLAVADALRRSAKERAENTMIVDLLRNDLGKIAVTGSVRVSELFAVERYPTVWQLTSTIGAELTDRTGLLDIFTALFPSGSVTGAPKAAAMSAIAALEHRPRGVYCGAVGYLAPDPERPEARFNVAIRTVTQDLRSGYAEYGTGGAITYPSRPDAEWAELLTKADVLRRPARPRGLIETLRYDPPGPGASVADHLSRLAASAEYFGIRHDPEAAGSAVASALAGRTTPARVRIVLTRAGSLTVDVSDLPPATGTVVLGLADAPVRSDDILLFHKHSDRGRYDRLRRARPGADDVILWNERREITETTIASIAVLLDGTWWTPPLDCGLLPGIGRARLLEQGAIRERVIPIEQLARAEGLAVVSSLRGWRPARFETPDGRAR
jgi:para-aminobenzoate synthetase/4-amino-4-deoxychorismate lyase